MKRYLVFVVLLFGMIDSCFAQQSGSDLIDSLKAELLDEKADTTRIKYLSQIAFAYSRSSPDSGLVFASRALVFAREIQWERGIANAFYFRGANYLGLSQLPEALDDYFNARRYFESLGDSSKLAGTLSNIGVVYAQQKKIDQSLEYFLQALQVIRKVKPKSNFEAASLGNIGNLYFEKGDYQKALDYKQQAFLLLKDLGSPEMTSSGLISMASVYLEIKDYKNALAYAKQAMEVAEKVEFEPVVANAHQLKGRALYKIVADDDKALLDSIYSGNRQRALTESRINLDSAVAKFRRVGDQVQLASTYGGFIELEEHEGNFQAALDYFKLSKAINDSLFTADNTEEMLQTSMQYEFDKKEAENKLKQEKKDAIQRNVRNSIAVGLAGTLVFLIVVYRQRNKIAKARKRSDELLLNILPEEVAEELKEKGSAEARHFDSVTILFTDFKGFTLISERLAPAELVSEINYCFSAFDEIMDRHRVEKIKTIGDAYMAVGGVPNPNASHAVDVVKAALDIQRFMKEYQERMKALGKLFFEIRIGVHTGTVVAGIVGLKKFQYDIWGDTVNTASRIESSGEEGKVNISGSTYELVKNQFSCTHRGKIQAKGKGELDMYFVEAEKSD